MIYCNEKEKVYIEIGDRQCGKTHRLVEDVFNYVNTTNETVGIMTPKYLRFDMIKQKIYHKGIGKNISKIKHINDMRGYSKDFRIYVDEMFYIKNIDNIFHMRNNVYINSSIENYNNELIESETMKKIKNYTSWRRKNIIDNLLKNNKW